MSEIHHFKGWRRKAINRILKQFGRPMDWGPKVRRQRIRDDGLYLVTKRRTVHVGDWHDYCARLRSRGLL